MMNTEKIVRRDLYYTQDHEWIDFQGTIAYIGICSFKLKGIKQIDQLVFSGTDGFMQQGARIASIKYDDYLIHVHMPVSGKLTQVNRELLTNRSNELLENAETTAWIAMIIPAKPYERTNLLLPQQYRMHGKGKFTK
jgi:glycine cleavage system H protein